MQVQLIILLMILPMIIMLITTICLFFGLRNKKDKQINIEDIKPEIIRELWNPTKYYTYEEIFNERLKSGKERKERKEKRQS